VGCFSHDYREIGLTVSGMDQMYWNAQLVGNSMSYGYSELLNNWGHVITQANPLMRRAAAFYIACNGTIIDFGRRASTALQ